MLTKLWSGWHFMRWFRLVAGILLAWQAYVLSDSLYGFIATFFLLQALTDTGCCGTSCSTSAPYIKDKVDTLKPEFEIINHKSK